MDCSVFYDFLYSSLNNSFKINSNIGFLPIQFVKFNYKISADLCKIGCKNFNLKFSCPPHSPSFDCYTLNISYIVINAIKINTWEQKRIYNSIRMANVIARSIQKKAFNSVENKIKSVSEFSILENGSCRLCKKCNLNNNLSCKYPKKMHPSLEATGVDVNDLVKKTFGFELQWYKKGRFPEYQCVVGGILTNEPEIIQKELSDFYKKNYVTYYSEKTMAKQFSFEEMIV